ncbi:unnamed protein product [Acanthoscelides obtectus]|uniref:Uncharacterized protein n=1 Tax=Acanthoscelides obtectus TaxID=200917 RepID=A0A9P0M204_ACAOB|nr:unnamed protein product [Acanthoscelides obtectus]CAK1672302.1 hypothetical protein AOBTE_LOCUS28768 [Acanthoscelides obtectus]
MRNLLIIWMQQWLHLKLHLCQLLQLLMNTMITTMTTIATAFRLLGLQEKKAMPRTTSSSPSTSVAAELVASMVSAPTML